MLALPLLNLFGEALIHTRSAMRPIVSLSLIFILGVPSVGALSEESSEGGVYGDLMILDQQKEISGENHFQVLAGYDVTNPYLNTYSFSISYLREWSSVLDLGLEGTLYSSQPSRYNETLREELSVFGITADQDRPSSSAFGLVRLRLLDGRVNLLGLSALPFRFYSRIGSGVMWQKDHSRNSALTWGLEPALFPTAHWGISIRFDQDIDGVWSGGKSIYRNRLSLALSRLF